MVYEIATDIAAGLAPVGEPCEECSLPVVEPDAYIEKVWREDGSVGFRHIGCDEE